MFNRSANRWISIKTAILNGGINDSRVVLNNPASTDIHMPDLGVAGLAKVQTYRFTGGLQEGMRVIGSNKIQGGLLRHLHRVANLNITGTKTINDA